MFYPVAGWNGRRGQASEHYSSGSAGSGTTASAFSDDESGLIPSTRKLNSKSLFWRNFMLTSQAVACAMAPLRRITPISKLLRRGLGTASALVALLLLQGPMAMAQPADTGGEANLKLPDLSSVDFLGMNGKFKIGLAPGVSQIGRAHV